MESTLCNAKPPSHLTGVLLSIDIAHKDDTASACCPSCNRAQACPQTRIYHWDQRVVLGAAGCHIPGARTAQAHEPTCIYQHCSGLELVGARKAGCCGALRMQALCSYSPEL